MDGILKVVGIVIAAVLLLPAAAFVLSAAVNAIVRIKNRALLKKPMGQFVHLDGHDMNVLVKGQGKHTLVFLSGLGTVSPVLDFKALYSQLEDGFRIVVPEKFGYGFSDIVKTPRRFEENVELYRRCLSALGIEGPYILCAHSISGLEAMRWAQRYPREVEAIVGLDTTPADFADGKNEGEFSARRVMLVRALNLCGLSRFGKPKCLPHLTEEEKRILRELSVRNNLNDDVVSESRDIANFSKTVRSAPLPVQPCIHFIAQQDPGVPWVEQWRKTHQAYADASTDGKLIQLSCGHYVHDFEHEKIAAEIRELAKRL